MPEQSQAKGDAKQPQKPNGYSLHAAYAFYKGLPIALRRVLVAAFSAFLILLLISIFHPSMAERVKFFTVNALSLFVLAAIAVQALIYRQQAGTMERQWKAMTDQLEAINKQEGHLLAQAEAAKTQSEVMARQEALFKKQTAIMDKTLVYGTRAYVGVLDPKADFRARILFLYIENVGKVPANDLRIILELQIQIPRSLSSPTTPPKGWGAAGYDPENWGMTVPFLHVFGKRTKLFPGQTMEIVTHLEPYHVPRTELLLLERGDPAIKIRVRGEVRYSDGFHSNKATDYDFRYVKGRWISQRIDEPIETQPDPEKPETDYNPE